MRNLLNTKLHAGTDLKSEWVVASLFFAIGMTAATNAQTAVLPEYFLVRGTSVTSYKRDEFGTHTSC